MATRGPKRKTAQNSRQGAPVASPWQGWRMPKGTPDDVRDAFQVIAAQAEAFGTKDRISPLAILAAARDWAQLDRVEKVIAEEGDTLPTNNGMVMQHPAVAIKSQCQARLRRLFNDFGLILSSKATPAADDDATDKWGGLIVAG